MRHFLLTTTSLSQLTSLVWDQLAALSECVVDDVVDDDDDDDDNDDDNYDVSIWNSSRQIFDGKLKRFNL